MISLEPSSETSKNILIYGFLDKLPELENWTEGYSPYDPKQSTDKKTLFGRGCSDQGWDLFSLLAIFLAMQNTNQKMPKINIILETEHFSKSENLFTLLQSLKD